MINLSTYVQGLKPGEKYTQAEIAANAGVSVPTVSRKMGELIRARYFKDMGLSDVDTNGRRARTYSLDIAAGSAWSTSLTENIRLNETLDTALYDGDMAENLKSVRMYGRPGSPGNMIFSPYLFLARYMLSIGDNPSGANIEKARAELMADCEEKITKLSAVINAYTALQNSIETNAPLESKFLDTIIDVRERLAKRGTTLTDVVHEMEAVFAGSALPVEAAEND